MTVLRSILALLCSFPLLLCAQDSPAPVESPSAAPTPASMRSLRISFLPPPLEGKISLGIYNSWDQLVRVLFQEATFDEFTIGADALQARWDGKDNDGLDAPPGKYHARGFLVAPMKIDEAANVDPSAAGTWSTKVKLVANPLEKNERPAVDLAVGFDDENVYLETTDGLPLVTLAQIGNIKAATLLPGRDAKSVVVQLTSDTGPRAVRLSGLDKMMAFDAGDFELK